MWPANYTRFFDGIGTGRRCARGFVCGVSYWITDGVHLNGTDATLALTGILATNLIGFLILAVPQEAVSQIIGRSYSKTAFGVGAQILIPGMPLLIELMALFDVLIVVACFGVLVRYLQTHVGTTTVGELNRPVG